MKILSLPENTMAPKYFLTAKEWRPPLLLGLLVYLMSTSVEAASPTIPAACPAGSSLIDKSEMSISSEAGGYSAGDAARLIDNTWNGWAPNKSSEVTATVSFPSQKITQIQFYAANNTGTIEWKVGDGSWQTRDFSTAYDWNVASPANGAATTTVSFRRNASDDDVVEINLCGKSQTEPEPELALTTEQGRPTVAASCTAGSLINKNRLTIATESGGWSSNDAQRLIDGGWSGWSPNNGVAEATIDLSGQTPSEFHVFSGRNDGAIEWSLNGEDWNTLDFVAKNHWHMLSLPSNEATSFQLKRTSNLESVVEVNFCGGTPPVSGDCTYDPTKVKQSCPAEDSVHNGKAVVIGAMPSNQDAHLGDGCRELHDLYWTIADDGKAYRTWHPPTDGACRFKHEHGDNPMLSAMILKQNGGIDLEKLAYIGGFPAFGFVANNHPDLHNAEHKHEDHVGHKVVVANDLHMAFGSATGPNSDAVKDPSTGVITDKYDNKLLYAGFKCHWLSKIHQGTHSADAMRNNAHEYFLNLECTDNHQGAPTKFSVKKMALWGKQDVIKNNGNHQFVPAGNLVMGPGLSLPMDAHVRLPGNPGFGDERGFSPVGDSTSSFYKTWGTSMGNSSTMGFTEIWKSATNEQIKTVGGGFVSFNPYYHVFNPSRVLTKENGPRFLKTAEACEDKEGGFCSILGSGANGSSVFNGGVRGVNFKGIKLDNAASTAEVFCTDANGENPQNPTEVAGQLKCVGDSPIKQRASTISTGWSYQANEQFCIREDGTVGEGSSSPCVGINISATLTQSKLWRSNGKWMSDVDKREGNHTFLKRFDKPSRIGYEWISNHGSDAGVQAPN